VVELREIGASRPADSERLLSAAGSNDEDGASHKISVAPLWMSVVDEVNYNLHKLKKRLAELSERHERHLLPGSFDDSSQAKQSIELLTDATTRLFQETKRLIKSIAAKQVENAQEEQIKRNLQSSLATQLSELSAQFRRNQRAYLQRLEGRESKRTTLLDQVADVADEQQQRQPAGVDQSFTQLQQETVASQRAVLAERDREIRKIAQSVSQVVEIFKDLSQMVIEQGTILDRVDHNIAQAEHLTRQAHEEVKKASKELRNARQKYCMIALCVAVIAVVLFILIKTTTKFVL